MLPCMYIICCNLKTVLCTGTHSKAGYIHDTSLHQSVPSARPSLHSLVSCASLEAFDPLLKKVNFVVTSQNCFSIWQKRGREMIWFQSRKDCTKSISIIIGSIVCVRWPSDRILSYRFLGVVDTIYVPGIRRCYRIIKCVRELFSAATSSLILCETDG